jgi:hypothetical protein
MRKKSVVIELRLGNEILFRARCHALGNKTVVDSSVPTEAWLKTEICGLLAMVAVDLAPDPTTKMLLRQVMGSCGHETEGEPEELTQEQFAALLGGKPPSVPDNLPW